LISPFPRLVHAGREAERILALVPREQRFEAVDFEARRDLLFSPLLRRYQILHIATHGRLDAHHPELSELVFSLVDRTGRPLPGFVRLDELYTLRLPVELVVLSACETALGERVRGEGVLGMPRGFLHAGAARVLVTLWPVHDAATAELMERFYTGLLRGGLAPPAALRAAQLALARNPGTRAPYWWAGFTLQGEWRPLPLGSIAPESSTNPPRSGL
jgi:CHAT domain-containing protein